MLGEKRMRRCRCGEPDEGRRVGGLGGMARRGLYEDWRRREGEEFAGGGGEDGVA